MFEPLIKSLRPRGFAIMMVGLVVLVVGILINFYVGKAHPSWATVGTIRTVSLVCTIAGFTIYFIGRMLLTLHKKALKQQALKSAGEQA